MCCGMKKCSSTIWKGNSAKNKSTIVLVGEVGILKNVARMVSGVVHSSLSMKITAKNLLQNHDECQPRDNSENGL